MEAPQLATTTMIDPLSTTTVVKITAIAIRIGAAITMSVAVEETTPIVDEENITTINLTTAETTIAIASSPLSAVKNVMLAIVTEMGVGISEVVTIITLNHPEVTMALPETPTLQALEATTPILALITETVAIQTIITMISSTIVELAQEITTTKAVDTKTAHNMAIIIIIHLRIKTVAITEDPHITTI